MDRAASKLQQSVFGRLDTITNEMTEWILPLSKPAGFVREPDGTVWIAMSQGSLIHLDLESNRIVSYRGPNSFAYSGIVPGADGKLYLSDFGSNRIVRFDPDTGTEIAWQEFDPITSGRTEITQPTLDGAGHVFVVESIGGGAVARLDLSTGEWDRFGNGFLLDPTHFFLQGNFVYAVETDLSGGDGRFVVVDMNTVAFAKVSSSPVFHLLVSVDLPSAVVRTFTLTPLTFQSSDKSPDGTIAASTPAPGISRFTLPSGSLLPTSSSFSIAPINGKVVSGCAAPWSSSRFSLREPNGPRRPAGLQRFQRAPAHGFRALRRERRRRATSSRSSSAAPCRRRRQNRSGWGRA